MYKGKPIYYGVGNFLLDQSWSEETSTAIFADATLYGDDVVQTRPVPFIILDRAQPNFLTPEGEGTGRCARFTPRPSDPSSSLTGDADDRRAGDIGTL